MLRRTPTHPKFVALVAILRCPKPLVVGVLELLWHFTAEYAPEGDVGRWSDGAIAEAVGWEGDAAGLVAALTSTGWLDPHPEHRLVVHDWNDHCDRYVRRKLARRRQTIIGDGPAVAGQEEPGGGPGGDQGAPTTGPPATRRAAPPVSVPEPEPVASTEPPLRFPPEPVENSGNGHDARTEDDDGNGPDPTVDPVAVHRLVAFASRELGYPSDRAARRELARRLKAGETEASIRTKWEATRDGLADLDRAPPRAPPRAEGQPDPRPASAVPPPREEP